VIDMQLLTTALLAVGFVAGLAILASVTIVALSALTQRHARRAGIRQIERLLAAVAEQRNSTATR
jgi:hypothetical protein